MSDAFTLEGVTKRYGQLEALNVPGHKLERGKIHVVIGPNGSGKTSLLRILNLLEPPTTGTLTFCGQPATYQGAGRLALQRRMSMVFQRPVMLHRSVYDNVAYGLKVRRVARSEAAKSVAQAIDMVGLSGMEKQLATTLSGGEAQRVALARAMVLNPEVLLLDEPTASLDPASVVIVENIIKEINRQFDMTIILVTHNLFQARRLADEVLFLWQGQLVETGPAEKFFLKPKDPRTSGFLTGEVVY